MKQQYVNTSSRNSISYDVTNLHPFIPIDKGITILMDVLNNDLDDLNNPTKLTLTDIRKFNGTLLK